VWEEKERPGEKREEGEEAAKKATVPFSPLPLPLPFPF
jgi:hypothetical protein